MSVLLMRGTQQMEFHCVKSSHRHTQHTEVEVCIKVYVSIITTICVKSQTYKNSFKCKCTDFFYCSEKVCSHPPIRDIWSKTWRDLQVIIIIYAIFYNNHYLCSQSAHWWECSYCGSLNMCVCTTNSYVPQGPRFLFEGIIITVTLSCLCLTFIRPPT